MKKQIKLFKILYKHLVRNRKQILKNIFFKLDKNK